MFDRVFASIAGAVSAQYGGPYHPALAIWQTDPVLDDGGSIIDPGGVLEIDCSAQGDSTTEDMRRSEGYSEKDIRIIVLGLAGLDTDATLTIATGPHAGSWTLQSCDRDPVGVGFVCRGRQA